MLEEGKITSEEAVRLIEALEDVKTSKDENKKENKGHESQRDEFFGIKFNSLEDIGTDISNAFSNMFTGLKDLGESFGFKPNYEVTLYDDLNMDISHLENPNLDLKSVNGSIQLRPSNSEDISIKVHCQHKKGLLKENEAYFDFYLKDNTVVFKPKFTSGISIKLDVFLPEKEYGHILLNSTNGKIDVDKLKMDLLECTTSNSPINILYIDSKEIILSTKNGKIESQYTNSEKFKAYTTNAAISLTYINSDDLDIKTANGRVDGNQIAGNNLSCKTSNGSINLKEISFNKVKLTTSNGRITCDEIDTKRAELVDLTTSNGSINSKIKSFYKEISFDLETSMGSIKLETPGVIFTKDEQSGLGLKKIIAHTADFNSEGDNLEFNATTSNGSIHIL